MKVLIVSSPNVVNPFTKELESLISRNAKVSIDDKAFWREEENFDLLLFQWPEELFKDWKEPSPEDIKVLKRKLSSWRRRAKLGIIRHNFAPHYRETTNFAKLYDSVFRFMDFVIHLGNNSRKEYSQRYKNQSFVKSQKQVVIPHPMYTHFHDSPAITRDTARQTLQIPSDRFLILVFGSIRHKEEMQFISEVFNKLRTPKKHLLISSYPLNKYRGAKYLNPILKFLLSLNIKRSHFFGFVPEMEVQSFFKASDLVFIPRRKALNSGNLISAFTFKKVVVGPNIGNIGEILEASGNPTFDFENPRTAVEAIEKGKELATNNKGEENHQYAVHHWSHEVLAEQYRVLINDLI